MFWEIKLAFIRNIFRHSKKNLVSGLPENYSHLKIKLHHLRRRFCFWKFRVYIQNSFESSNIFHCFQTTRNFHQWKRTEWIFLGEKSRLEKHTPSVFIMRSCFRCSLIENLICFGIPSVYLLIPIELLCSSCFLLIFIQQKLNFNCQLHQQNCLLIICLILQETNKV